MIYVYTYADFVISMLLTTSWYLACTIIWKAISQLVQMIIFLITFSMTIAYSLNTSLAVKLSSPRDLWPPFPVLKIWRVLTCYQQHLYRARKRSLHDSYTFVRLPISTPCQIALVRYYLKGTTLVLSFYHSDTYLHTYIDIGLPKVCLPPIQSALNTSTTLLLAFLNSPSSPRLWSTNYTGFPS